VASPAARAAERAARLADLEAMKVDTKAEAGEGDQDEARAGLSATQ
jgi:hypothetical protein